MLWKKFTRCCIYVYQFVAQSYHLVCLHSPPFSSQLVKSRCKNFVEITSRVYDFRRVYVRNPRRKHGKHEFTTPKERSILRHQKRREYVQREKTENGCQWTRHTVNSSLSRFFTFVTSSLCDDLTLWRFHCDELYDWCLLYSTLAVGVRCPSVAVVCWWRTRANQFWDDFFIIILCQILRLKCIKFDFDWGSAPTPLGSLHLQRSPDHLDLSGSTSKGREGKERERRWRDVGREERREGKERV